MVILEITIYCRFVLVASILQFINYKIEATKTKHTIYCYF